MIETKYFGNGKKLINVDKSHVVQTKEYYNLIPRGGGKPLPAGRLYVACDFIDEPSGSFATVKVSPSKYVDIEVKSLDYIRQLDKKNGK